MTHSRLRVQFISATACILRLCVFGENVLCKHAVASLYEQAYHLCECAVQAQTGKPGRRRVFVGRCGEVDRDLSTRVPRVTILFSISVSPERCFFCNTVPSRWCDGIEVTVVPGHRVVQRAQDPGEVG